MNLELLLTILIILIIGIIFLKAIRKILSVVFCLVVLYCVYYTFFTYNGALKLSLFREEATLKVYSERFGIQELDDIGNGEKYFKIDYLKDDIKHYRCTMNGPVILCDNYKTDEID